MAAPIGEIIAGAVEGTFNSGINIWNTIQQQQKFDYDKAIQQQIFQREDTAVQRRMADLQAAGLNPQLAAGSGAGAGSVVSTQAPQMRNLDIGAALDTAMAVERIKQAKQQTKNLEEQWRLMSSEMSKNNAQTAIANEQAYSLKEENMFWYGSPTYMGADGFEHIEPGITSRFREYMKYQMNNYKNSSDLLQKQNDWFTANQIISAVGNVLGDVSGLAGGFNNTAKGLQLLRPKFK